MVFCSHREGVGREMKCGLPCCTASFSFQKWVLVHPKKERRKEDEWWRNCTRELLYKQEKGGDRGGCLYFFCSVVPTLCPVPKKAKLEMSLPKCISFSVSLKAQNLIWLKASAGEEKNIFALYKKGPCLTRPWHHSFLLGEGKQNSGK